MVVMDGTVMVTMAGAEEDGLEDLVAGGKSRRKLQIQ